jgi:hypothetical protein
MADLIIPEEAEDLPHLPLNEEIQPDSVYGSNSSKRNTVLQF